MYTTGRFTLYDILQVPTDAPPDEIRSAFRKLSLIHHPDKNHNSPESSTTFKTIHNAYTVLSNPQTRREYDSFLLLRKASPVSAHVGRSAPRPSARHLFPSQTDPVLLVLGHLNSILWDIETLLHSPRKPGRQVADHSLQDYVIMMLTFLDTWVLDAAGYSDNFFAARNMVPTPRVGGSPRIPYSDAVAGHAPYANVEDYFYDVRRRMDRFLSKARISDLLSRVKGTPLRLVDCIFEGHNYCVHYLGWIERTASGSPGDIPPFSHSDRIFDKGEMPRV